LSGEGFSEIHPKGGCGYSKRSGFARRSKGLYFERKEYKKSKRGSKRKN